jgi:hypothetical protein
MIDRKPFTITRRLLPVVVVLLAVASVLVATPVHAQSSAAVERYYELSYITPGEGIGIASNLCLSEGCVAVPNSPTSLRVRADLATQEKIAKALHEADVPPADQSFQLILLQAERSGTGDPGPLPPSAQKALADLKDFLPYSRYEFLDSAFVRTNREARMVVQGMGGHAYEAQLRFRGDARTPGGELLVDRFLLRLVPADVLGMLMNPAPGSASSRTPHSAPSPPSPTPRAPTAPGATPGGESPQPAAAPTAATPAPTMAEVLLDTAFSLRRGETVVVGTSKLDGGRKALVVLLTALP